MVEHTDGINQSALIRALRRENRRLWGEIEARQAAERERLALEELQRESVVPARSAEPEAADVAEMLEAMVTTVSLAIHDECVAMADALATRYTYTHAQSEMRTRADLAEQFTALAARMDRMTSELMSIREILDDLREAQRLRDERAGIPRVDPAEAVWRPRPNQSFVSTDNGTDARTRPVEP
jgi:hypothetical protein